MAVGKEEFFSLKVLHFLSLYLQHEGRSGGKGGVSLVLDSEVV